MTRGTPRGFRDVLPAEALEREAIAETVRDVFSEAGYVPVETPLLESRAVLERAGRLRGVPFQLFDTDDALLMLRPELTLPIARLVTSRMTPDAAPLRLRYAAPVVREQASGHGQPRQLTQMGVELIGGEDGACEAEVMDLLAATLAALGVEDWTLCAGSVRPLAALLSRFEVGGAFADEVEALVHASDLVGLDEALEASGLPKALTTAMGAICRLHGGIECLDDLEALLASAGVGADEGGVDELRAIVSRLGNGARGALSFDFSVAGSFDYYTGVIFKAYAPGLAGSLASGGRYDAVLANLDVAAVGAAGFAFSLERLQEALAEPAGARRLRVAVPKGALFEGSLAALEAAGCDVSALDEPGRHLSITSGDVDYLIVRASDAPAFVAYGGADCGICGSDSLYEADLDLLSLLDLRFGGCRFVVAEPRANAGRAERALAEGEPLRVATKYPRITEGYFEGRGVPVEVLALHGNIELAPLVGMTDCIVDITATGTTLRENDLAVVAEVLDCSARFFASPAAYRSDGRVRALADALAASAPRERAS